MIYVAIFFILILFLIALMNISIEINYSKNKEKNEIHFNFSILRKLIKFKHKIVIKKLDILGLFSESKSFSNTDGLLSDEDSSLSLKEMYEKFRVGLKNYKVFKQQFNYIKKHLLLYNFALNLEIGTNEASSTAIISGICWSLGGMITSLLDTNFKTNNNSKNIYNLDIKPQFSEKKLDINMYCIFSIKFVYIIIVIFKSLFIFFNFIKDKNKK